MFMFDGYRRTYLTIYLAICMNSEQSVLWSLVSYARFYQYFNSDTTAMEKEKTRTHKQKQTKITKAPKKKTSHIVSIR